MSNIRIIIADDHQLFRDGLSALLSSQPDFSVISSVGSGAELLDLLEEGIQVDIVLLDLSMPEMNGFEVLNRAKRRFKKVRFIVISMHEDGSYISKCIRFGAFAYLLKNIDDVELFEAVRSVYQGRKYFNEHIKDLMVQNMALEGSDLKTLSKRESEVLNYVAQGKTTKEIAAILYVSTRTVETHRVNMMKKLMVQNTAELIRKATQLKLI
ncbi:MAG: response regulator transcription factor [Saprospiraceae bacterium]|nr:response regulator transcription factor [Saprospiraceae bacterium]